MQKAYWTIFVSPKSRCDFCERPLRAVCNKCKCSGRVGTCPIVVRKRNVLVHSHCWERMLGR
uniref:Uncharacterized protein n=1 Tax=Anopheles gambiae TaxID=7165 RepID=A0A903XYC6_ANOGA